MRSPGVSALALRVSLWTLCSASSDSFIKSVAGSLCSPLLSGSCVASERSPLFCRLRGWDWLLNSWQKKSYFLLKARDESEPHTVQKRRHPDVFYTAWPHRASQNIPALGASWPGPRELHLPQLMSHQLEERLFLNISVTNFTFFYVQADRCFPVLFICSKKATFNN